MPLYAGIDLGTTFTAAAVSRGGRPEMVTLGSRSTAIPSAVLVRDDGSILTGEVARRRGMEDPSRLAVQFKRRVGDPAPLRLGGSPVGAHVLLGKLLRWVVEHIEDREGERLHTVAVTHPANWGAYKQEYLSQAIAWAEIERAITLTEPEAAAIHYSSTERVEPGTLVAVYDLGGGTFDAAVLRKTDDGFEIAGEPQGVEQLGGIDFDETLFQQVMAELGDEAERLDPDDPAVANGLHMLRSAVTEAKIDLSTDTQTSVPVALPGLHRSVRITREEFETAIRPAINDTVQALERALRVAGVEAADLSRVLLVGGSSRIPLVAQTVTEALGRPVAIDADPKHAIALGAAISAAGGLESAGGIVPNTIPTPAPSAPSEVPEPTAEEAPAPTPEPEEPTTLRVAGREVSPAVLAGGALAIVAAIVLAVVVMSGGGTDTTTTTAVAGSGTTAAGTTSDGTTIVAPTSTAVTTSAPGTTAESGTGIILAEVSEPEQAVIDPDPCSARCATIDSILIGGSSLEIAWTAAGFTPDVTGFHAHFYWGDQPAAASGTNAGDFGESVGNWELTDDQPFVSGGFMRPSNRPLGVDTVCVTVADSSHGVVDPAVEDCAPLPDLVSEWSTTAKAAEVVATSAGFDGSGRPVVAWLDADGSAHLTRCEDAGCSSLQTPVSLEGNFTAADLAPPGDAPVVALVGSGGVELLLCADGTCDSFSVPTIDPVAALDAAVARSDTGDLVVAYQTEAGALRVAICAEPCDAPTIVEVASETDPGIGLGGFVDVATLDGLPVIAYLDGGLAIANCLDRLCSSATAHVVDPAESGTPSGPTITVGATGSPTVAYLDEPTTLTVLECVDPACTASRAGTPLFGVGVGAGIVTGPSGYPTVVANRALFSEVGLEVSAGVLFCGDPACTVAGFVTLDTGPLDGETLPDPATTGWVGVGISVALGDDGLLVAYRGADGELVVARPAALG